MANVAGASILVNRSLFRDRRIDLPQCALDHLKQLVECGPFTNCDIEDLIQRSRVLRSSCEQIRLNHIVNKAKIAARFAIAKNVDRMSLEHRVDPARDDRCISTAGILLWTE